MSTPYDPKLETNNAWLQCPFCRGSGNDPKYESLNVPTPPGAEHVCPVCLGAKELQYPRG